MATTVDEVATRQKPGRTRARKAADRSESRLAWYLLIPAGIFLMVVVGYPIIRALYLSLFSDNRFGTSKFIGLHNYYKALFGTGKTEFWAAFNITVIITVITVIIELIIGFAMALIMHRAFKGRGLVRASVLVPWAIPTAVSAQLFAWIFQPSGVFNSSVIHKHIIWGGSKWPSVWAIIIADTWKTAPFIALLLLAGLQIIPDELYEAAKVDGATAMQRFRSITIPLLKSSILVAVLFRMLDVLRMFDLPFILTHGANGTTTLSILAFQESIQNVHIHYGSALSTITFITIVLAAFLFTKLLGASVVKTQARNVR